MTRNRPTPWKVFADKPSDTICVFDANRKEVIPWPGFDLRGILPWRERVQIAKLVASAPETARQRDDLLRQRDELADALGDLLVGLDALIADSEGVVGLHLNGDVAPWSELLPGGRFEAWLLATKAARTALANAGRKP